MYRLAAVEVAVAVAVAVGLGLGLGLRDSTTCNEFTQWKHASVGRSVKFDRDKRVVVKRDCDGDGWPRKTSFNVRSTLYTSSAVKR